MTEQANAWGERVKARWERASERIRQTRIRAWFRFVAFKNQLLSVVHKRLGLCVFAILILLCLASTFAQTLLTSLLYQFSNPTDLVERLRSLLIAVGSALMGASVIISSLILFALQINVERMPHGLFRKLTSDWYLLCAIGGVFALAISVAVLSLFISTATVAMGIIIAFWLVVFQIFLFYLSYRRALTLINPSRQLSMLVDQVRYELEAWGKKADRAAELWKSDSDDRNRSDKSSKSDHDIGKAVFFKQFPGGTKSALEGIDHAMAFATRYAEHGDYDVSAEAWNSIATINLIYVRAKGKTFYAGDPYGIGPSPTDEVINHSLEHARRIGEIARSRQDERQITQTFAAIALLINVYLRIDYSSLKETKQHAILGAEYLAREVRRTVSYDMPDVTMNGLRQLGDAGKGILKASYCSDVVLVTQSIAKISAEGVAKESNHPITLSGMQQLSDLMMDLLRTEAARIKYPVQEVRKNIELVCTIFLEVPDSPLRDSHRTYLGPYYSVTDASAFVSKLAQLVNIAVGAESDEKQVTRFIENVEQWAEDASMHHGNILSLAVKKRSALSFDLMYWTVLVADMLLALRNCPACPDYIKDRLKNNVIKLVWSFLNVPDEKDSIEFLENYQLTERVVEAAVNSLDRKCLEALDACRAVLLSWMYRGAGPESQFRRLDNFIVALIALDLLAWETRGDQLKISLKRRIAAGELPNRQDWVEATDRILDRFPNIEYEVPLDSAVVQLVGRVDRMKLREVLEEVNHVLHV